MKIKRTMYRGGRGELPALGVSAEWAEVGAWNAGDLAEVGASWAGTWASSAGHNVWEDTNYLQLIDVDRAVPVSPLLVRDLAGRVVYIGNGPEARGVENWAAYYHTAEEGAEALALARNLPAAVFPKGCAVVPDEVQEMLGVEQVVLAKWRCLENSLDFLARPSAHDPEVGTVAGNFLGANLHPYKLRMDSFYTDGWRLPQVEAVFALPQSLATRKADTLGEELVKAWEGRPAGEGYDAWVERMGGEAWAEDLFAKGCTLIPTFEGHNGYVVVGEDYSIKDYWPGRAVPGLHMVEESRADKAPVGTILDVLSPGYVTGDKVVPARVVVSDGTGYVSPHMTDLAPLIPNLFLPHTRCVSIWGACWLPTRPRHFEPPALWGWDVMTGKFLQQSGPLWDPLHYVYESVDVVRAAVEAAEGKVLVEIPDAMAGRFYPITALQGFDVLSVAARDARKAKKIPLKSALARVPRWKNVADGAEQTEGATLGYHPLPLEFEVELDSWGFPELHPANRAHGVCPEELEERICPVALPKVSRLAYFAALDVPEDALWLRDEGLQGEPTEETLENYPYLIRYVTPDLSAQDVLQVAMPPFLSDPGLDWLTKPVQELWAEEDNAAVLDDLVPGLHADVWNRREMGIQLMRVRHHIYRSNIGLYTLAWWRGMDYPELIEFFDAVREGSEEGGE